MDENNECEWFTICDEKNILLEKNENNVYKITFSIISNNQEDTVLNVLKNGQFFELLSQLNPDVIDKINVMQNNNIDHVFMTLKNNKEDSEDNDKVLDVCFSIKYIFKENKCIISSHNQYDDDDEKLINKLKSKNEKEYLHVSKIKLKALEKNNKTIVSMTFKIENKKSNNIINMYIGLYFKKIFYRFKKYFE
jgi:hypothetical protein